MLSSGAPYSSPLALTDGLRSAVRKQIFPEVEPAYCGYVAWRSIVDEEAIPAASREWLKGGYWFVLPPNEMFLSYGNAPVKMIGELMQ